MGREQRAVKIYMVCAIAVSLNVVIGSLMTYLRVPFLYLDAIGTVFIAFNFDLKHGVLTGLSTNFILAVLFGPLAIPFSLVSVTIAIVANLCSKKGMTYKRAVITGILIAAIGALVSAPIRLVLFDGFEGLTRKPTDMLVVVLKSSGFKGVSAAYWGAFVDSFFDKVISCVLVVWLFRLPQLENSLSNIREL